MDDRRAKLGTLSEDVGARSAVRRARADGNLSSPDSNRVRTTLLSCAKRRLRQRQRGDHFVEGLQSIALFEVCQRRDG